VNKGSDMAVFGLANPNISSNDAVWRILGSEIHEQFPAVMHLSVHLENGQRVYFTEENAPQRAANPPNTTLTVFFNCVQLTNLQKRCYITKSRTIRINRRRNFTEEN